MKKKALNAINTNNTKTVNQHAHTRDGVEFEKSELSNVLFDATRIEHAPAPKT